MSTNSAIGIKRPDNTIHAVYCHWDGYPKNNGMLLVNYFNTTEKVEELLSFGDISSLGVCVESSVFYHRDRGEKLSKPNVLLGDIYEMKLEYCTAEWLYVFDDGFWKCYDRNVKEVYINLYSHNGDYC